MIVGKIGSAEFIKTDVKKSNFEKINDERINESKSL